MNNYTITTFVRSLILVLVFVASLSSCKKDSQIKPNTEFMSEKDARSQE